MNEASVSITTMFRFSCFHAHINSNKSKKSVQPSLEAMQKTLEDHSEVKAVNGPTNPTPVHPLSLKVQGDTQISNSTKQITSPLSSADCSWKSDEIKSQCNTESDDRIHQTSRLKKSQSLGSGLYREGRESGSNDTEDEMDQELSCDDSRDHNALVVPNGGEDLGASPPNQYQGALPSDSVQVSSDIVNNESIFSTGGPQHLEKEGPANLDTPLSGDSGGHMPCSPHRTPRSPPVIVKSCSLPNFGAYSSFNNLTLRSRSSDNLHDLDKPQKESIHDDQMQVIRDQGRYNDICGAEKSNCENPVDDGYDSYHYAGSAKDWVMPVMEETHMANNIQGESSSLHRWDEGTSTDFNIKRIQDWVIGLQHCTPLEERSEPSFSNDEGKGKSIASGGLIDAKFDAKVTPGMEVAKRYISSLNATATTAQLANHGLVVIPFLSAFVSLRVLNLSGNAIVRITAGALPRGLHMLNLSKNNISTIEGLRELTRLRVLDLSYNRIFRIGHGLASCTALKELYLAGNKISEVEGLHRLLKLTVLDLRFNKISTAKCLGQLAANYISLQAISLEGNPAQKNVGDEQLKKQLQGLLPHLVYFNRQPIKVSTLKDAADRSVRLGINAHQFDRGLRAEHKTVRKGAHGVAAHKPSSSSNYGRKSQALVSPKQTRGGRHVRLPPTGTKGTTHHRHHYFDFGSKLLGFGHDAAMHRSRSEGTLGAL